MTILASDVVAWRAAPVGWVHGHFRRASVQPQNGASLMEARTPVEVRSASRPDRGRRDLTQGPITRTLLVFSLPLLGGNALQSLNGTVNQIWVSHTLGETAITALGNANIVMMLMMAAIFGVGMAANILVAQAVGAGDRALRQTSDGHVDDLLCRTVDPDRRARRPVVASRSLA